MVRNFLFNIFFFLDLVPCIFFPSYSGYLWKLIVKFQPFTPIWFHHIWIVVNVLGILFQFLDCCLGMPVVCDVDLTKLGCTCIVAHFFGKENPKKKEKEKKRQQPKDNPVESNDERRQCIWKLKKMIMEETTREHILPFSVYCNSQLHLHSDVNFLLVCMIVYEIKS